MTDTIKTINDCLKCLNFAKEARRDIEDQWYINQMFIEHDQIFRDESSWSVSKLTPKNPKGIYRNIAKARKMLRDIRNSITKNDPRWNTKEIYYDWSYDENEIDIACLFLKEFFRKNHMKQKIKDLLYNSFIKSIAFAEVFYDWEWEIQTKIIDTFDIYLDRFAELEWPYIKSRFIIKACPQTISALKTKYPKHTFAVDNNEWESERKKQLQLQDFKSGVNQSELWTAMIYDMYTMVDAWVQIITYDAQGIEIDKTLLKWHTEYPIIAYQPERMGGKIYPTPRINPVIELNKSYNRIFSSMEERVHAIGKGRLAVKKWSKVSNFTSSNWQIIEYDTVIPQFINPTTPWEAPFAIMWQIEKHIEDTWWVHSESSWRMSSWAVRSWVQVSQIQMGDALNVSEPVDNMEEFLSALGTIVLNLASKNYTTIKKLYYWWEEYDIVWAEGSKSIDKISWEPQKAHKIKPFKNIKIEIIPWTAYTDAQARSDVLALLQAGVKIDEETILETFKFGNIREILYKMKLNKDKQQSPDVEIANWENKKMLMGQQVMANQTDDHRIHKAIHATLLESVKDNQQIASLLIKHIKEHELFTWWIQQMDQVIGWQNAQQPQQTPQEEPPIPPEAQQPEQTPPQQLI